MHWIFAQTKGSQCYSFIPKPIYLLPSTAPLALATTILFSISIILSFQEVYVNVIVWYVTSNHLIFFSHIVIAQRLIQTVVCINSSFLLFRRGFHGMGVPWFVEPFTRWRLSVYKLFITWVLHEWSCYQYYRFLCESKFLFFWVKYMLTSLLAVPNYNCIFSYSWNSQNVFLKGYTILHSHQQCINDNFSAFWPGFGGVLYFFFNFSHSYVYGGISLWYVHFLCG